MSFMSLALHALSLLVTKRCSNRVKPAHYRMLLPESTESTLMFSQKHSLGMTWNARDPKQNVHCMSQHAA